MLASRRVWGVDAVQGAIEELSWSPRALGSYVFEAQCEEDRDDAHPGNATSSLTVIVRGE